jgi:hypothetical protein
MATQQNQFDLTAAKETARDDSDKELFRATGSASNAFDDILMELFESKEMTAAQKTDAMMAIATNAKAIIQSAMTGQQTRSVASGSDTQSAAPSDRSSRSGDEDRDLANRLAAAESSAQNAKSAKETAQDELNKFVKAVEQATGVSVTRDRDGKVTTDVKSMITSSLDTAKQQGRDEAAEDGSVSEASVREAHDLIKAGWDKKTDGRMNSDHTVLKNPTDATKVDDGLEKLGALLS